MQIPIPWRVLHIMYVSGLVLLCTCFVLTPGLQGTFSPPPSNVLIASNGLVRSETVVNGCAVSSVSHRRIDVLFIRLVRFVIRIYYNLLSLTLSLVTCSPGINGESSFEADLLTRAPGCQVWGYDFSVSSVSFFHAHYQCYHLHFLQPSSVWS